MGRLLERVMAAQDRWTRPFGDFNHRWLSALFRPIRPIKDALNGTWYGHPIHAALSDGPLGILLVTLVLDWLGKGDAADVALVLGILAMLAAAAAGAADYTDTDGRARARATLHATLMVVSLAGFVVSLGLRAAGAASRGPAIVIAIVAYIVLVVGAIVGGDVVYRFGNMVDRHAWRTGGAKWAPLEVGTDELPEGTPTKARLGANALVLVRVGDVVHALHDQCAHAGGPLSGGTVVDGCIECPWHGSRFRLADGRVRRGPAVYDQPVYEVRRVDGGWEARRAQG